MNNFKVNFNPVQKILLKRYLNKNGQAQQRFTQECEKQMNPYVPFKRGVLKDLSVKINEGNITYRAPYARKQYYTNAGQGKQGMFQGGLRGKHWDKRMWQQRGKGVVKTIANFVGGKAK